MRTLLYIRDSIKDILERSGKRAAGLGASLNENGSMHLPLRFPGNGWLNLVPINFLVKAVTAIMESGETGIFHIVNPKSDTIGQLAQHIAKYYAISGLEVTDQAAHNSPLQTLINSYMDVYYPDFCDKRRFCNHRTRIVLEPLGFECPELTSAVFKRCKNFAVEAGWRSKIRV